VIELERYVALGDSTTEGLEDPDGAGGYRGWADRFAEHIARVQPRLQYANLAVRGLSAAEIRATQLAPAIAMRPQLATVVAGMNDLLRRNWDAARVTGEIAAMVDGLASAGARVIIFTIPDVSQRMRLGRALSAKTAALNAALVRIPRARVLDLAAYALARDPRMWAADRIHGNPAGHARIAAALAHLIDIPGVDGVALDEQLAPEPPRSPFAVIADDVRWVARFVAPWAWRRLRGRTAGDGLTAKRPALAPVTPAR
jgi:lysophospholipase L1-like esterase